MRVFVSEYLSTGAMPDATSLAREGLAMLVAVVEDLSACVEVVTAVAEELADAVRRPGVRVEVVAPGQDEIVFRRMARECSHTLVIAPEFDDLLGTRVDWAQEEGSRLLGPTSLAIRQTGDKLALAERWKRCGIATPETCLDAGGACPFAFPVVVKPRFGAGALATFRIDNDRNFAERPTREGDRLVQPCVGTRAGSVAFLRGPGRTLPLLPAWQDVRVEANAISYHGGSLPALVAPEVVALAQRAVECVPGLHGYVGVDFVIGDAVWMIEINPRLTTSYVGLRRLARFNVMQAMLDALEERDPGPLTYRPGEVHFTPDGTILERFL